MYYAFKEDQFVVVRNHSNIFNTDFSKSVLQPFRAKEVSDAICMHHYIIIPLHKIST